MNIETTSEPKIVNYQEVSNPSARPLVFDYTNFRTFLADCYAHIKRLNPSFSESAFIIKAGYKESSRGYFSLIINGKRNLSSKAIIGFSKALKLNKTQMEYFEALVLFNQAKSAEDKEYHFSKMTKILKGKETTSFKLLKAHFNICSKWYLIPIREMITLEDFVNDPDWIAMRLRGLVTASQVIDAIEDLKNIGLVKEDNGKLIQAHRVLSLDNEMANNEIVTNYHKQMMDKVKEILDVDDYSDRSASSITFTCDHEQYAEIKDEIAAFRESLINKYGVGAKKTSCTLHMGIQLIYLTEPNSKRGHK